MVMQEFAKEIVKIHNEDISEYIDMADYPIFHYTSPAGLNGIISNNTLRFTDRNYLNDQTEGRYVMQLCLHSRCASFLPKEYRQFFRDKCEEIYRNPSSKKRLVYQCSFSLAADNLALWNYYTKGDGVKGYNLCFSAVNLASTLETHSPSNKYRSRVINGRVIYNVRRQKLIVQDIVKKFGDAICRSGADAGDCQIAIEYLVEKLLYVGSFFKAPCFKHEEEYRLIIRPFVAWDDACKCIMFINLGKKASTYEKNGLLIPYVDIEFPKTELKQITVSPTLDFTEVGANIKNALRIFGYPENTVAIYRSNIPIRY